MATTFELKSVFATLPRTARGKPIVIGGDPKGKNFLYTNNNSVIIRDIENPAIADIYTEHSTQTTVAKYSPSGFYIASGDKSGKIRIWDTVNKEHILKNEFQPFAGEISDLSWSADNQRIAAGGAGREKFGHVFNAETGTSVGEIMGVSKAINGIDFKPTRPFRLAAASEDSTVAFFEGPPFKFKQSNTDHSNFVNTLRYAPSGDIFISGGADGKAFIYDGKTGERTGELGPPAHKGGIYAISFSSDSQKLLTVSGDKTAKIWDIPTSSVVTEFVMGKEVNDMQVGCLWQDKWLLTVSLSGFINYLDPNDPSRPYRIIKGHQKPITALGASEDRSSLITSSNDGGVCCWDANTGESEMIQGKGHSNMVQDLSISGDVLASCGVDDKAIISSLNTRQYGNPTALPSQPKKISASSGGLQVVACENEVLVLRNGQTMSTLSVDYGPSSVDIHPGLTEVAVGGSSKNNVYIYTLSNDVLSESKVLPQNGQLTAIRYSPSGAWLAAGDSARNIFLYEVPSYQAVINSEWCAHTAKPLSLSWAPSSNYVASGGLDGAICCFEPPKKSTFKLHTRAHAQSTVSGVQFLDENTIATVGHDSILKLWKVMHA